MILRGPRFFSCMFPIILKLQKCSLMLFGRVTRRKSLIYVSLCFFVTLARAPFGGHRLKGRRSDPPPATHAHAFTMMRAKPHPAPPPPPQPRRQRQRRFTSGRAAMPSFTNADHPLRAQARSPSPIWLPQRCAAPPSNTPSRQHGAAAVPAMQFSANLADAVACRRTQMM